MSDPSKFSYKIPVNLKHMGSARFLRLQGRSAGEPGVVENAKNEEFSESPPWMADDVTAINVDSRSEETGPFGHCIYCGKIEYIPGAKRPLGGEHVVMAGIGGTIELLEASCFDCERATSAVDSTMIENLFDVPRRGLRVKSRAKFPNRKLKLSYARGGIDVEVRLPFDMHPKLMAMPQFSAPAILVGGHPEISNFSGCWADAFEEVSAAKYPTIYSRWMDMVSFALFLAKTAHAFATYKAGEGTFAPALTKAISTKLGKHGTWAERHLYVGGRPNTYPATSSLHELSLLYQKVLGQWILLVRIRLFACLGAPVYLVAVGSWLGGEPPSDRVISITS